MARRVIAAIVGAVVSNLAVAAVADPEIVTSLQYLDSVRLYDRTHGLTEPSGLALASDGTHYWTVSDETGSLFQLTASGKFKPSRTIKLGVRGLEGVADDPAGGRVMVVAEDSGQVVSLDLADGAIHRFPLKNMANFADYAGLLDSGGANDGLEGITVGPSAVFALKEKHKRVLIELSSDLSQIIAATELTAAMGFVCDGVDDETLDVSDITWDARRGVFWILSDTGLCVFLYDMQSKTAVSLPIAGPATKPGTYLKHPEGIALTPDGDGLLLVTDDGKDSRLYSYAILSAEP